MTSWKFFSVHQIITVSPRDLQLRVSASSHEDMKSTLAQVILQTKKQQIIQISNMHPDCLFTNCSHFKNKHIPPVNFAMPVIFFEGVWRQPECHLGTCNMPLVCCFLNKFACELRRASWLIGSVVESYSLRFPSSKYASACLLRSNPTVFNRAYFQ